MLKDELCVGAVEGQLLVLVGAPIEGERVVAQVVPALLNVQCNINWVEYEIAGLLKVERF